MKELRIIAAIMLSGTLLACSAKNTPNVSDGPDEPQATQSQVRSPSSPPASGISSVDEVKVTPAAGDKLQLRGSSFAKYEYSDLMATLYCRAWRHTQANGFDGAYPLRFHKLQGGEAASAHVAIASVQMFRGSPPKGQSPLDRSWCSKIP